MRLRSILSILPTSPLLEQRQEDEIQHLTNSSFDIKESTIFFAIKGTKFDGYDFIEEAVNNGASYIIYDKNRKNAKEDVYIYKNTCFIAVDDVKQTLLNIAAIFWPNLPEHIVAVTGTSGKSSVAFFTNQLWQMAGYKSSFIGTLGVSALEQTEGKNLTTPSNIDLFCILNKLKQQDINYVVMEASSHGIDQGRVNKIPIQLAAFTNLGRDHLDYHKNIEEYFNAKKKLLKQVVDKGGKALIFADDAYSEKALAQINSALTIGKGGSFIKVLMKKNEAFTLNIAGKTYTGKFYLLGEFQWHNALMALGLAIVSGTNIEATIANMAKLQSVPGRLELIAKDKAHIYVDYAHKPEALENVLTSLAKQSQGRIILVFGCGGNRDKGKREIMGTIASNLADIVIVTDDNPRFEDPQIIRDDILKGASNGIEIADRAKAIKYAMDIADEGDIVLIAGKGHETGQEVNGKITPFSDKEQILKYSRSPTFFSDSQLEHSFVTQNILWSRLEILRAIEGELQGSIEKDFTAVSIDSRNIAPGSIFFAIKGNKFDGHDFARQAYDNGAALLVVENNKASSLAGLPILLVEDSLKALEQLARASRQRTKAKIIAITGSLGKTSLKELCANVLSLYGKTYASYGSYNNHWGVPLALASMPRDAQYAVFELGMNHCGELLPLSAMVLPYITVITAIAPAHIGNFSSLEQIAKAKSEIYQNQLPSGLALINSDTPYSELLVNEAQAFKIEHVELFGKALEATHNLQALNAYELELEEHKLYNIIAVEAILKFLQLDNRKAINIFKNVKALRGRGEVTKLKLHKHAYFTIIDETYNANPASMKQALLTLANRQTKGRKIAVIGDMLELGAHCAIMHKDLAQFLDKIDFTYLVGKEMRILVDWLDKDKFLWSENVDGILAEILCNIAPDDIIMLKSSNAIATHKIVSTLKERYK